MEKGKPWRASAYVVIPRALLKQDITPSAFRLWVALASFGYGKDEVWPSNKALLDRMPPGTHLRTAQKAKKELEEAGLITQQSRYKDGRQTSSLYVLIAPEGGDLTTLNDALNATDEGGAGGRDEGGAGTTQNIKNKNKIYKKTVDGFIYIEGEGWVEE